MSTLQMNGSRDGESLIIEFSGDLSEGAVLKDDFDLNGVKKVIIDLDNLGPMNSVGIKSWAIWIKGLAARLNGAVLCFRNCRPGFIDAANLTQMLIPAGACIDSFYVPYFCEDTEDETAIKFENGVHFSGGHNGEKVWYKAEEELTIDDKTYELDVVTSQYFSFLDRLQPTPDK